MTGGNQIETLQALVHRSPTYTEISSELRSLHFTEISEADPGAGKERGTNRLRCGWLIFSSLVFADGCEVLTLYTRL